ncbi:unnamed protein product [Protopolystoma xenopodis]|uniref:Uncharacterized protein n=1 Tax=Protopolystoma xenopodis TaxID=117903 RepID=A0A448WU24_9PLAT|nr:unnamed protein product [Protopolystoma xenopodis]
MKVIFHEPDSGRQIIAQAARNLCNSSDLVNYGILEKAVTGARLLRDSRGSNSAANAGNFQAKLKPKLALAENGPA